MVNCINLIIEMSPRFVLGRENVPCVAEVVNRSLKADCTGITDYRGKSIFINLLCLETTPEQTNSTVVICLTDNARNVGTFHESKLLRNPTFSHVLRDQAFGVNSFTINCFDDIGNSV